MRQLIILILCTFILSACSKFKIPSVHRIPVQQGNYLEYKDVEKIKVGMSKDDVKVILGTPVVGSLFNQSRWEYVYKLRTERYGLFENLYTVYFEEDIVTRFESDIEPPVEQEVVETEEESEVLDEVEVPDEADIVQPNDEETELLENAEAIVEQADQ